MDAVITWVDGSDPAHQKKLNESLENYVSTPESAAATRFSNDGEIEFSVMSLFHFATWVDRVYIVTDQQTPHFYKNIKDKALLAKIKIIDHRVLFEGYTDALPVFNSLSIEALLWNIPGLSDDFIYLNDDMMLIRPVPASAFRTNDKYIFKGNLRRKRRFNLLSRLKKIWRPADTRRVSYRELQERCADLIGYNDYFLDLPHCPHILNRNVLKNFFCENFHLLKVTLKHKFRHPEQVWSVSLFCHQTLSDGLARIDNRFKTVNIKADLYSEKKVRRILNSVESSPESCFLCVQSLDMANNECRQFIKAWMAERLLADGK